MHFPFKNKYEIVNKYRFNSIFWTYFRNIFIIVFIPIMMIPLIISLQFFYSTRSDFSNFTYNKLFSASVSAENAFDEIDRIHYNLTFDIDVNEYASNMHSDISYRTSKNTNAIYNKLGNYTVNSRYIRGIHVYFPVRKYVISNNESNSIDKYSKQDLFLPALNNQKYQYTIYDKGTLYYVRPIYYNSQFYSVVIYDVKISDITMFVDKNTNIYIAEKGDNQIFYTNVNTTGKFTTDPVITDSISAPKDIIKRGDTITISFPIYSGNYNFIGKTHMTMPKNFFTTLLIMLLFMMIIALLISLLVAFHFSSRFYSSITELISAFGGYNDGIDENANELMFLSNSISDTIKKNKLIENQLIANVQKLKELQIQVLQMQTSPHFIFNTLNIANIIIMRELKHSNDAEKVIVHLANLISIAFDKKNIIIPLTEELRYCEEFIEIEKIRFKNRFDIIYDISEEVVNRNIIKFTLQPILENAFEHGIKLLKNTRGKINVRAWDDNGDTVIIISNNGEQIDLETLNSIRKTLVLPTTPQKHIGLYNVNKRIKLICGEKYGLTLDNLENCMHVTIRFKL